jgi:hypothetical protein
MQRRLHIRLKLQQRCKMRRTHLHDRRNRQLTHPQTAWKATVVSRSCISGLHNRRRSSLCPPRGNLGQRHIPQVAACHERQHPRILFLLRALQQHVFIWTDICNKLS